MAQPEFKGERLSYYPPRSRWYSRFFFNLSRPFRHYFNLDAFLRPVPLSPGGVLLALALPGYSFFALERRLFGWIALAAYVSSAVLFLVALGYLASGVAYGLLISVHATSIIYLESRSLQGSRFSTRIVLGLLTLFAVWGLCYGPVVRYTERHWFMPLRIGDRVMVSHTGIAHRSIRRGDWVVYTIEERGITGVEWAGRGVVMQGGLGVDPVLALPGDRVRFTSEAVLVNDQPFPREPFMPGQGESVMPENVWFIWPHLGIDARGGGAPAANISALLQQTALVTREQIIGRPFKHWFWRRQWP